jgi:catechol 2,3-dioxygenase-like lactoylglutathione lyase family enzyme
MKRNLTLIIIAALVCLLTTNSVPTMKADALIQNRKMAQVAIVVKDIEKARKNWAMVLGMDVPEVSIAKSHPSRPTKYKGTPSSAEAKLAFFNLENIQIELIEPLGGNSTWQEFLDTKGEGIHHIAFMVKGIDGLERRFEMQGMHTDQNGGWDGGAYSYINAMQMLGCELELLENYRSN